LACTYQLAYQFRTQTGGKRRGHKERWAIEANHAAKVRVERSGHPFHPVLYDKRLFVADQKVL
jgi:hypothetical protein